MSSEPLGVLATNTRAPSADSASGRTGPDSKVSFAAPPGCMPPSGGVPPSGAWPGFEPHAARLHSAAVRRVLVMLAATLPRAAGQRCDERRSGLRSALGARHDQVRLLVLVDVPEA